MIVSKITCRCFKTDQRFENGPVESVHEMFAVFGKHATLCWRLTVLRGGRYIFESDP